MSDGKKRSPSKGKVLAPDLRAAVRAQAKADGSSIEEADGSLSFVKKVEPLTNSDGSLSAVKMQANDDEYSSVVDLAVGSSSSKKQDTVLNEEKLEVSPALVSSMKDERVGEDAKKLILSEKERIDFRHMDLEVPKEDLQALVACMERLKGGF